VGGDGHLAPGPAGLVPGNILSVALVAALAATYRRFPFSMLSYGLMTVFLTLHTVAAHYTYSEVPAARC